MNLYLIVKTKEEFFGLFSGNVQECISTLKKDYLNKFTNSVANKVYKKLANTRAMNVFKDQLDKKFIRDSYSKDIFGCKEIIPKITPELVSDILHTKFLNKKSTKQAIVDAYTLKYTDAYKSYANTSDSVKTKLKRYVHSKIQEEKRELINMINFEITRAISSLEEGE